MKRLFVITSLAVSACAGTSVASVEVALTGAEHAATTYVTQPACPAGTSVATCSDPSLVAKIKAADNLAYTAVQGARAGTVSTADAMKAVNALSALVPTK